MNMNSTNPNQMYMPLSQIAPNMAAGMFVPPGQITGRIAPGQQVIIQAPANTQMHVQVIMADYIGRGSYNKNAYIARCRRFYVLLRYSVSTSRSM